MSIAVLAAALQTIPPPPELSADHEDDSPGAGYEWVVASADQVVTTNAYWHWNTWKCENPTHSQQTLIGIVWYCEGDEPGRGVSGKTVHPTPCQARGTTWQSAESSGCPRTHTLGGDWTFKSHRTDPTPIPGQSTHHCQITNSEVSDPSHCGTWVLPDCDPDQHRHGTGVCEADHDPEPDCPADNTAPVTLSWTEHDSAGNDTTRQKTCPVPECDPGEHKHGTGECEADHTPPPCIDNLPADQTGSWTPDHDGHASVTLNGCDPVTSCGSGQHNHAPAVPGGHRGCRTAHTAPSCTWNTAGTWSPGHGGQATDGHATTTGMRVCVSVRHFCIDSGGNILLETVDRQTGVGAPDYRGLLPAGYHRDRIPHSTNLNHTQLLPRLTLGGQTSPASVSYR